MIDRNNPPPGYELHCLLGVVDEDGVLVVPNQYATIPSDGEVSVKRDFSWFHTPDESIADAWARVDAKC